MRTWFRVTPLLSLLLVPAARAQNIDRANEARKRRVDAADFQRAQPLPIHQNNNDQNTFGLWAVYSKGLPHDFVGEPDGTAFFSLYNALTGTSPLEDVILGGERKLVNPQAGLSYVLEGADPQALTMRPAPSIDSNEAASEMEELYWMSLLRDVSFSQYASDPVLPLAIDRLNAHPEYRGAKNGSGQVTPGTVFRADLPGAINGPFISQFLYKTVTFGGGPLTSTIEGNPPAAGVEPTAVQLVEQRILTRKGGDDSLTDFDEWRSIQDGHMPDDPTDTLEDYDATRRYIRNARDLTEWVHLDYPIQGSLNAALLMARQGDFLPDGRYDPDPKSSPLIHDGNNPYRTSRTQEPFVTFGNSEVQSLTGLVTNTALRAMWYQKWQVHRRLRPEEYGGRIHAHLSGLRSYPQLPAVLLGSPVLSRVRLYNLQRNLERGLSNTPTYLLPQAFREGSPLHPAYGSGHSTYTGAGVTILKAFHTDAPILNPQVPNADGTALVPYSGTLMMFDELDKLASNIGVARLFSGVHYRSDHDHAVRLGELYALRVLQDWTRLYNESFSGFEVRTFGGNVLTVTPTQPALPHFVSAINGFALYGQTATGTGPGTRLRALTNNAIIDLSDLAAQGYTRLNIVADTFMPQTAGSVRFQYDSSNFVDSQASYFLFGDTFANGSTFTVGTHVLRATPYSAANAGGVGGVPLVIRFTVQQ
ncbi:vanadium-dependent haloperoxidase [Pyxidicoccus fallax]|uniref:Vanadium-dependent haloperoxidase n=1 Tax=Pyxidicoccus fallax TaxID=394095 RepID=A0A848LEN3_9BACT|nr:vanadium-dependent haloperoxidase [Pyxidicoccus fallax]NMO15323.1 vanadium-dependent haloperoxidase [Pyxidicoccus fallax]NPC80587.1 vanadium-dependent haloperoxidase [Pyxidicoccus fallax]